MKKKKRNELVIDDGEYRYVIEIVDDVICNQREAGGGWNPPKGDQPGELVLLGTVPWFEFGRALLHETIHCAEYAEPGLELYEGQIDRIAGYFMRLFVNSPQYLKLLTEVVNHARGSNR